MAKVIEGSIDTDGSIKLSEGVNLPAPKRVLVTILDEPPQPRPSPASTDTTLSSEEATSWRKIYQEIEPLAEGGMGRTFKAVNRQTGQIVCIKELKVYEKLKVLAQECSALSRINHPSVVKLLGFDVSRSDPYLVMEFVEGQSLKDWMKSNSIHDPKEVVPFALHLFDAISSAHALQVIHRDLKPSNIIRKSLAVGFLPVIVDFGLSIVDERDADDDITALGKPMVGTAAYMAPEQLRGELLTPACDIYSLGQILWELLTGKPAFGRSTILNQIRQKLAMESGLELPKEIRGKTDKALRRIIRECTEPDPQLRPQPELIIHQLRGEKYPSGGFSVPFNLPLETKKANSPTTIWKRWFGRD